MHFPYSFNVQNFLFIDTIKEDRVDSKNTKKSYYKIAEVFSVLNVKMEVEFRGKKCEGNG